MAEHVREAALRDAVGRGGHLPAAAELGRDDDLPLPLGLADEQARAGDVDVDEVDVGVPGEHPLDHLPALLGDRRPSASPTTAGRSSARPPLCMSTTMSARGKRKRVKKSASCSSGGPSGEPGNERLRFAPDGQRRV